MNYLEQLKAFDLFCEINAVPVHAQIIWYKLMSINNKCGWIEWFGVDNKRLMCISKISNEKTLIRNRDKLIQLGLIVYRKGQKGQPSQYKIKEIDWQKYSTNDSRNDSVNDSVNDSKNAVQMTVETTAINKHKHKLKQKQKDKEKNIKKESLENLLSMLGIDEDVEKTILDFIEMRKLIKKPMTDVALKLMLTKLVKLSSNTETQIKILEQSILNSWQGIFPIMQKNSCDIRANKFAKKKASQKEEEKNKRIGMWI